MKKKKYPTNLIGTKFTEHEEDVYSARDLLESEEKQEKWKARQIHLYGDKLGQKRINKILPIKELNPNPNPNPKPIKGSDLRKLIIVSTEEEVKKIENAGLSKLKESECLTRLYQILEKFQERLDIQDDLTYDLKAVVLYMLMVKETLEKAGVNLGDSSSLKNSDVTFNLKSLVSQETLGKLYEYMVTPTTDYNIFEKLFRGVPIQEVQKQIEFKVTFQEIYYMLSKLGVDSQAKYQTKFERCQCLSKGCAITANQIREARRTVIKHDVKYAALDLIFSDPIEKNMG